MSPRLSQIAEIKTWRVSRSLAQKIEPSGAVKKTHIPAHHVLSTMSYALESFARNSLAQFIQIYSEVVAEHAGPLDAATLERLMWTKITGGMSKTATNKVPWALAKKIKIQLPYLPHLINYSGGCQALRKCDGLYVPCGAKCTEGGGFLCLTCEKHAAKFGVVEDRGDPGNYTDPEDKREITYGTWLQKHEKTIEDVNTAIQEAGFTFEIPPSYLAVNAKRVVKHKPGRPKSKLEVTEDSDSESESEEEPEDKVEEPEVKAETKKPAPPKKKATEAPKKDDAEESDKPVKAPAKKTAKKVSNEEEAPVEKKYGHAVVKKNVTAEKAKAAKKAPKKKGDPEPLGSSLDGDEPQVLGTEEFELEEDEQIVVSGVEYILRGKTIFNVEGVFVGTMVNGAPVFRNP